MSSVMRSFKMTMRLLLLVLPMFVFCAEKDSPCITPNLENGTCIPLHSCTVMYNAVLSLNDSALDFARNSACGFDTDPLYCCGTTAFPVYTTDPPESKLIPDRSVCGFSLYDDRIFGGSITEIGEFPWMALLSYKKSDGSPAGFRCGGTLINNRYVLTAGHCVRLSPTMGLTLDTVRLGEWNISSTRDCSLGNNNECSDPVIDLKIEKQIAHSNYSRKTGDNDIALIRLERNVAFTKFVRPICLPSFNPKPLKAGTKLVVAGWGNTENGTKSDVKLKLRVPLIPNKECLIKIKNRGKISDNQLCAGGEKGRDSCQGDSGGPLMAMYERMTDSGIQWYQKGVIAWGVGCGFQDIPGVYTEVSKYLNWILSNMSEF